MRKRFLFPAALALIVAAALPAGANAADYVPGQVLVRYKGETSSQEVQIGNGGASVPQAIDAIRQNPDVASATPNYIAHAAGGPLIPNDPGFKLQWDLNGPFGINMPEAWAIARSKHAPGGRGATVAVLDTGVAYRTFKHRYKRSPDLRNFLPGRDYVDHDHYPFDLNGHGTWVASEIAATTNNGKGAAGVAYRAKIMPLRVLDAAGAGDTSAIAKAIRYAGKKRVDVINMSLEFDSSVRASQIPDIVSAVKYARKRGSLVVAAAGNQADATVAYPGRAPGVVAVAATTYNGCEADYSNAGRDVDVSAPGGGVDAPNADDPWDAAHCRPDESGHYVYQETFTHGIRSFGLPGGYEGTSMAAPHVSGIAALLVATRRLGKHPSPHALEQRIKQTSHDIGPPGFDNRYGWGLVDAAAALR
jgi:serine protease